MNKWLEILIGLVLVIAAVFVAVINFWGMGNAALALLKGSIVWGIGFVGLILLILGIMDLKE